MKHCVSLTALAEYIGQGPAARLSQALGGLSIKIPKHAQGKTWEQLVGIIGESAAATLCEHFGSEGMYIANNHRSAIAARRAEVAALRAKGLSFAQISAQLKYTVTYTERGVRKLAQQHQREIDNATASRQRTLFDAPAPHPLMAMFAKSEHVPADTED